MNHPATDGPCLLLTGAAGFIGFHAAERLLQAGWHVIGIDNVNDYYSIELKRARLDLLQQHEHFTFHEGDIADASFVDDVFSVRRPDRVIHLAAQAGVRYSLEQPRAYIETNITGFFNIMEACRAAGVDHFVFASSSSVYGANRNQPLSVERPADHPINLYAATKRSNELMAHAYSHLHGMPATGLRFFTVYGPWGRPDMAYFKFTKAIMSGTPIEVYNNGEMWRDFTYIDDIIEGLVRIMDIIPETARSAPNEDFPLNSGAAPFAVYNIGGSRPEKLMDMIQLLEKYSGRKAEMIMRPMQPGEIEKTYADTETLTAATGFTPQITLDDGLKRFMDWYQQHYS